MTLIGFATYGDHAEFITDTMSYTSHVECLGRVSKHMTLPHLSAAVLSQGDSIFGSLAKSTVMQTSAWCATYDELVREVPDALEHAWAERLRQAPEDPTDSVIFLLGWSDDAQEFLARMFVSEQGFKTVALTKPFLTPTSYNHRPSGMEMRRLWAAHWGDSAEHRSALDVWSRRSPLRAPQTDEQWIELAQESRLHRSLSGTWARVIVAGDLFHTRISRDEIHTRKVHEFDDQGQEFLDMIAWTRHPLALAAECYCGSSETYGDCCGTEEEYAKAAAASA